MTTTFDQIATSIIKGQESIIGSIAWQEAAQVAGLTFDDHSSVHVVEGAGEPAKIIDQLVGQYELLFGRAARETSREAASSLISNLLPTEVPSSLK